MNNQALTGGVMYGNNSIITVTESSFSRNLATESGGAVYLDNSSLTLESCIFIENSSSFGGVMLCGSNSFIDALDTYFLHNFAIGEEGNAGVLAISSSTALFTNCSFIGNAAYLSGVISASKHVILSIDSSCVFNNSALFACNTSAPELRTGYGGVINAENGVEITISFSRFVNNTAGSGGCGYVNNGILKIYSSTFDSNMGIYGGAFTVVNSKMLILGNDSHVKFVGNLAQHGGALNIIDNSIAHIQHSRFEKNKANKHCLDTRKFRSLGSKNCKGGAILSRTNTTLHLEDTTFTNNFVIGKGGALFAQFASVESIDFIAEENIADSGAIYISSCSLKLAGNISFSRNTQSLLAHNSEITFSNRSTFYGIDGMSYNSEGGAMTAISSSVKIWGTALFSSNQAEFGGGGIQLTNSPLTVEKFGSLTLHNNVADIGGALNVYSSPIQIKGVTMFEDNKARSKGGALYLVRSSIQYYSSSQLVYFSKNSAKVGGAIYFDSASSQHILKEKAECDRSSTWYCTETWMQLSFTDNFANETGGALYVDDEGAFTCSDSPSEPIYKECFIQTIAAYEKDNDWNTTGFNYANINFHNNTAAENKGSLLYGGLLDRCAISEYAELSDSDELLNEPSLSYFATLAGSSNFSDTEIASDPVQVCFCNYNEAINCTKTMSVIGKRGQLFSLSVVAVDQMYAPIKSRVMAYLSGSADSHLGEDQSGKNIDATCTDLEFSVFSAQSESLHLYPDGPCGDNGISRAVASIEINPSCPVGFTLSNSSLECVCDPSFIQYFTHCDINTETVERHGSFWMASVLNGDSVEVVVHENCPYDYCLPPTEAVSIDLNNFENGSDAQCAFNRTGRLCGTCKFEDGYSLTLGSSRCLKCTNYWLFLIIPFGLVGICIVVLIMACNLTLASGTLNGLLFYANILIANKATFFPLQQPSVLTVFISWLGLNLGIPTCFYDGMDGFGKMWMQITFELYLIILMLVIILLGRFVKVANFYHNHNLHPVSTLATIAMLSYEKLSRNVFSLAAFTVLKYPNETMTVWLFDPTSNYFEPKHIPLEIVAFIIIVVGISFNFILLFNKVLVSRCKSEYFKQFFDSFYAPLKDNHRYWIGLLLIVRNISYVTSEFLTINRTPKYSLHVIFCLVVFLLLLKFTYLGFPITILTKIFRRSKTASDIEESFNVGNRGDSIDETSIKPSTIQRNGIVYRSPYLDLLETSFLINLSIFTYFTLYFDDEGGQDISFYVSSSIVLIFFVGILGYHVYTYTCIPNLLRGLRKSSDDERVRLVSGEEEYGTTRSSAASQSEV